MTPVGSGLGGHAGKSRDHQWRFDLFVAIGCPPPEVFAFLADVQDAEPIPRRNTVTMVKEPAGRTTRGTRWHEQVRIAPGLWLHVESVVTDIAEPSRLGMDFHSNWFNGHLTYEIQADTGGSLLRQHETLHPRLPMRWLGRFIEPYLRRKLVRRLQDIQQLLEREAATGSGRAPGG